MSLPVTSPQRLKLKLKAQPFDCFLNSSLSQRQHFSFFLLQYCVDVLKIVKSILGPKSVPKQVQKLKVFRSIFEPLILRVLKLFKSLLRAVLSIWCSSWEPPRLKKCCFPMIKSFFLQILLFATSRLLRSFLGPSWRIMADFSSKMAPSDSQRSQTNNKKRCTFLGPMFSNFGSNFGVHFGPRK